MKLIILTFFVLFVVVRNVRGDDDSIKSLEECLDESDIKDDFEKLKKRGDPRLRCIIACVMEKEGILKNGVINMDKLKEDILDDVEELGEKKVSELVDICGNLAKDITDICDKSNRIEICINEEFEKYDIKFDK